jgi:Ca2+/Na+ antiporter
MSEPNGATPNLYPPEVLRVLYITYVVAIGAWFFLFYLLMKKRKWDWMTLGIALLPAVVYLISIFNLNRVRSESEEILFPHGFLTLGVLAIIPLATWSHDEHNEPELMKVTAIAIALAVFSLIWMPAVSPKWVGYIRHLRAIFQIAALALVLYALYLLLHAHHKKCNS